jgi:hypothetical protein
MSDNRMIVVPVDPLAMPPRERAQAALELLCKLRPDAQDPELHLSETPEFHHCLANFKATFCPFCGTDVTEWWDKAMHAWWNCDDRRQLSVETPCCARATSLNDLDYDSPQGFACVAIELLNPGFDLEPEELQQVEAVLGVPLRIIWAHI